MAVDPVSNLLSRLENVEPTGKRQWTARCKGHDDDKNSLCIGQGDDGRALVKCQAGCETSAVLSSVGLGLKDLFKPTNEHADNGRAKANGKKFKDGDKLGTYVESYSYQDYDGKLLYQSVRFRDPKDFRRRRPNPNTTSRKNEWIWNVPNSMHVLLYLPEIGALRKQIEADGKPRPILVVEGEKDSKNLRRVNILATTSIGGADQWGEGNYAETLRGFDVVILPDNDPSGMKYALDVARSLHGIANSIKIVALPGLPEHGDTSDWLHANGIGQESLIDYENDPPRIKALLRALVDAAPVWLPAENDLKAIASAPRPADVAGPDAKPDGPEIIEADCVLCPDVRETGTGLISAGPTDAATLAFNYLHKKKRHLYNSTNFYTYSAGRYVQRTDGDQHAFLRKSIERQISEANESIKRQTAEGKEPKLLAVYKEMVFNAVDALKAMVIVPAEFRPPVWLKETDHSRNCLTMKNGILDLDYIIEGRPEPLIPHTDTFFSTVLVPYDYDPAATCPKWDSFLDRNFEGDRERIDYLQEFFGYCLLPDTRFHEFLLIHGEGNNGKSVVCAVLSAMLGDDNVSRVALETFGVRFALNPTLGKLANICSEVGELDKVAEGHIKAFVSGDPMPFEAKFKEPVNAVPTAKLVLATNTLPRFADRSEGIWRRVNTLPMRVSITKGEKIRGMDKVKFWTDEGQLPGVLNWAIEGLRRLLARDGFTQSKVCAAAKEEYRKEINPARAFLKEHFCLDPAGEVACLAVYMDYGDECKRTGHKAFGEGQFGKEVLRVFPTVERKRRRQQNDLRMYCYMGLRKKTEDEKRIEDENADDGELTQGTFKAMN